MCVCRPCHPVTSAACPDKVSAQPGSKRLTQGELFTKAGRRVSGTCAAFLTHTCHRIVAEIGPASVMVGNLVSGKRIAQASGRDLGQIEDNDQARKVSPGDTHVAS